MNSIFSQVCRLGICVFFFTSPLVFAEVISVRWTGGEDRDATFSHILSLLEHKTHQKYSENDFILQDDRDLAFNHYQRYEQIASGLPISGKAIRIWTQKRSHRSIQIEATLDSSARVESLVLPFETVRPSILALRSKLSSEKTVSLARGGVMANSQTDDKAIRDIQWSDLWKNEIPVRLIKAKGKHGLHLITVSLLTQQVIEKEYREFPQGDEGAAGDEGNKASEFSVPAKLFKIYEEVEGPGTLLKPVPVELKYIFEEVPSLKTDPYSELRKNRYIDSKFDPIRGETTEGRKQGYWSMSYVKNEAAQIRAALPLRENSFEQGALLQGRYATVSIHPGAIDKFKDLDFTPGPSAGFWPRWADALIDGKPASEMIPSSGFTGKPLLSEEEVWNRPARRLPDHNPATYLKDGLDELQVYYAINTLFDSLNPIGFKDPELSIRQFHAFLYDLDISMRDNAYYTDDTINFTTYSAKAANAARDNSTIWHELGHGVMDRLMGDNIQLADTGGLSEGMADFVAALVIEAVTHGKPFAGSEMFRIINHTGFYLTNEVHDDGEAYGGAMKDFLDASIKKSGHKKGLHKVADLILETMRLTRDHPALTAQEWFNHALFADQLGHRGVRKSGEMKPLLLGALSRRNYRLDTASPATFTLFNKTTNEEIIAGGTGSRSKPILVNIPKNGEVKYDLNVKLKSTESFTFKYPVQVKVEYSAGALQGAIHWVGKEKGPLLLTLKSEADTLDIPIKATGTCDSVNREDGSCVDYAYVQIWNSGEPGGNDKPVAKKRFYLRIKN